MLYRSLFAQPLKNANWFFETKIFGFLFDVIIFLKKILETYETRSQWKAI